MIKKIITIFLACIFLFSALTSCSDIPSDDSTQEISTASPETSEIVTEEPVLHSFSAREVSFHKDPFKDYLCFLPEKGSEESERWGRIYTVESINEELFPSIDEGEFVTITYSGAIEPLADSEYGFIENVHSVTLQNDPREYGGIGYGVGILRQRSHGLDGVTLNARGEGEGLPMLLAADRSELTEIIDYYLFYEMSEITDSMSDFQKTSIIRRGKRPQLLDGYDEDFFKSNDLLIIFKQAHSGSLRYDVTDITHESGVCTITVEELEFPHTDDIAHWMIFVSIPKEITASVTLYKTYMPEPEWMKGMN